MKLFLFGVGYCAEAFLNFFADEFTALAGTTRTSEKAMRLSARYPRLETFVFDGGRSEPALEQRVSEADALLVSAAPGQRDPALERFGNLITDSSIRRIVYLSTIGVYGVSDGSQVDETVVPSSNAPRSRARIEAEANWQELGRTSGKRVFILRLAGIYGPGRNAIESVRDGSARRIVKPGQVFNRIHVDDIARAIAACMTTEHAGGIFNVCDDEPSPPQDVIAYAAKLIGVAPPREVPFEDADLSPMAASFWLNNQRVSNTKMHVELGVRLKYPTYREGLEALAKTESA
jgi:nucleoside-diphosphate-sugar epimerase